METGIIQGFGILWVVISGFSCLCRIETCELDAAAIHVKGAGNMPSVPNRFPLIINDVPPHPPP